MEKSSEWIKPAAWGAVAGAVVIAIIGFSAGWVVTSGAADKMVSQESSRAVMAALTPICVAQFKAQSEQVRDTQIAALQGESSWKRGDYVAEQGWATMPGAEDPNGEVANACAKQLLEAAAG